MATLLRFSRHSRILLSNLARSRTKCIPCCQISTSDKKKDVLTHVEPPMTAPTPKSQELKELEEHFADADPNKLKNWISYGYDYVDREFDSFFHNMSMFIYISVAFCGIIFVFAFMPDLRLREWSQREAYLEIERRERLGLPLIDPNYIPPDQMQLPSDEELGDEEVII